MLPAKDNYLGTKVEYKRSNYLGEHFDRKMMVNTAWEYAGLEYDIFLCHTRWNHTSVSHVLNDHGEVFYFSILRDPVELFRSYFEYYKVGETFLGEIDGIKKWKQTTLEEYARTVIYNELKYKNKSGGSHGYNQMLTDFGLDFKDLFTKGKDNSNIEDKQNVEKKIKEINENFDLIILADEEYFEDSIILLKNALCWQYEDMIGLKLNSQNKSEISSTTRNILKGNLKYLNIIVLLA